MSFSRFTFYRSNEWRDLLAQLKIERQTEDGQILCEHCGRPIVRAYDCIGHHKTELTEENVNDYTISLNPDNIALVHAACHNAIHERFGRECREVFVIYGPPCGGMEEYVEETRSAGDLVISIDAIWESISGGKRYERSKRLKPIVFAVRDRLIEAVRYRLGKWSNAYVIGGYPNGAERERLAKELGAREVLIDPGREECEARLEAQPQGRNLDEWKEYIAQWYERTGTATD